MVEVIRLSMHEFVECMACGFVTYARRDEAKPRERDDCPSCGDTDFTFTDE